MLVTREETASRGGLVLHLLTSSSISLLAVFTSSPTEIRSWNSRRNRFWRADPRSKLLSRVWMRAESDNSMDRSVSPGTSSGARRITCAREVLASCPTQWCLISLTQLIAPAGDSPLTLMPRAAVRSPSIPIEDHWTLAMSCTPQSRHLRTRHPWQAARQAAGR
eukprot:scaffold103477_cov29-Tisochrysis_lutea.AAC.2